MPTASRVPEGHLARQQEVADTVASRHAEMFTSALRRRLRGRRELARHRSRRRAPTPGTTRLHLRAQPALLRGHGRAAGALQRHRGARVLACSATRHHRPHLARRLIAKDSPAGKYLRSTASKVRTSTQYGARRGNHEVMMRGTFANIRLRTSSPGTEGGVTRHLPSGEQMSIYDAAMKLQGEGTPLVVLAGKEYGTGSSRDWAAKGTYAAGREGRHRRELRAHPPLATWSAWACCRCSSHILENGELLKKNYLWITQFIFIKHSQNGRSNQI
jgi:aconitase A